jgi:phosphoglycolate phosphatase-like HAD superfamily hydrolase
MTRLAIFDIDGTLCDSWDAEARCFAEAVASVTGRPLPTLDWSRYAEPTSAGIVAEVLAGAPDATTRAREIEHAFVDNLRAEYASNPDALRPVSGAGSFLRRLGEERHCTVAIATGGFASEARFKLACGGIDLDAFPHATSSDAPRRRDIIALAISRAAFTVGVRTVYFGDGVWDVQASCALGLHMIGIGRRIAELQKLGVAAVFPDFSAQDAIIGSLNTAWHD